MDNRGKRIFFRQLAKNKNKSKNLNIKNLKAVDEVPSFLKEEFRKLEEIAYHFRKNNKGGKTQTKLDIKAQNFKLYTKKAGDTDYSLHEDRENLPSSTS